MKRNEFEGPSLGEELQQDPRTEEQLVADLQGGDINSFGELFKRYRLPVFRIINRHIWNPTEAEDITATTFQKAYEHMHTFQFRKEGSFGSLAFTIAVNLTINYSKSGRRKEQQGGLIIDSETPEVGFRSMFGNPHPMSVEDQIIRKEENEELGELLKILQQDRFKVTMLRHGIGLGWSAIAQIMGRSVAAVEALSRRALEDLREEIKHPGKYELLKDMYHKPPSKPTP